MKKLNGYLNRIKLLLVCYVLFTVLYGCDMFFENRSIAPNYIPLIEEGDTLVYYSDINIDSFYVYKAVFYNGREGPTGDEWLNERFYSGMGELGAIDSGNVVESIIIPQSYEVFGWDSGKNNGFKFRLIDYDDRHCDLDLEIGSYTLEDLYGDYDFDPDSITGEEIVTLLYSKKYGLVRYELTNGEVFTISEESLEMLMAREWPVVH